MLKFDAYRYKEEDAPKLIVSLDWFFFEDHWTQRYMFDHAMWNPEDMVRIGIRNANRHRRFKLTLNLFHYKLSVEVKLKHVGNIYHGRKLDDAPHVPNFVKRNRERKKTEAT